MEGLHFRSLELRKLSCIRDPLSSLHFHDQNNPNGRARIILFQYINFFLNAMIVFRIQIDIGEDIFSQIHSFSQSSFSYSKENSYKSNLVCYSIFLQDLFTVLVFGETNVWGIPLTEKYFALTKCTCLALLVH